MICSFGSILSFLQRRHFTEGFRDKLLSGQPSLKCFLLRKKTPRDIFLYPAAEVAFHSSGPKHWTYSIRFLLNCWYWVCAADSQEWLFQIQHLLIKEALNGKMCTLPLKYLEFILVNNESLSSTFLHTKSYYMEYIATCRHTLYNRNRVEDEFLTWYITYLCVGRHGTSHSYLWAL